MNKAVMTTIVALSLCFNAFAQEAKGKNWTEQEWKKEKGSYGWVFPHIDKNADGKVTAAEYEAFQEFKRQHPNWEIELNPNARPEGKTPTPRKGGSGSPAWVGDGDFPRNSKGQKDVKTKRPVRDRNTGKWTKLDYFRLEHDGSFQLYNLDNDPEEKNNLADEHPEMVKELHSLLNHYRASGRSVPVEQVDGVNN